jgi:hypothetical protein
MMFFGNSGVARSTDLVVKEGLINLNLAREGAC